MHCFVLRSFVFFCAFRLCSLKQWRDSNFYEQVPSLQDLPTTGPLIIQSPEANHAGWIDIRAKVDLCAANWYSLAKEIINFNYFPIF